jgi:hypothetical protein
MLPGLVCIFLRGSFVLRRGFGAACHVACEREVLARAKSVSSQCVRPVFINGDYVVIRWRFRFEWRNGTETVIEELVYQLWKGKRIAAETFFYDPAHRTPRAIVL